MFLKVSMSDCIIFLRVILRYQTTMIINYQDFVFDKLFKICLNFGHTHTHTSVFQALAKGNEVQFVENGFRHTYICLVIQLKRTDTEQELENSHCTDRRRVFL